jgi:hypothetical protein
MADKPKAPWQVDYFAVCVFILLEIAVAAALVFGR